MAGPDLKYTEAIGSPRVLSVVLDAFYLQLERTGRFQARLLLTRFSLPAP